MDDVETFEHAGFKVRIVHDPDCTSPLENDNFSVMVCWHPEYKLGDKQRKHTYDCSAKAIIREVRDSGDRVVAMLPLYLYEHSGMTIKTGPFTDLFDSGQVGWAYVTRERAKYMGCIVGETYVDHETKETKVYDKACFEEIIRQEVKVYDDYITEQCYGYVVEDKHGKQVDSCWGFVGELDYVRKQAKEQAAREREADRKARKHFTKKAWKAAVAAGETEESYEGWLIEKKNDKEVA